MFYPSKGANLLPYRIEVSLGIRVRSLDYNCNYDCEQYQFKQFAETTFKEIENENL